jgi:hypothetical protein
LLSSPLSAQIKATDASRISLFETHKQTKALLDHVIYPLSKVSKVPEEYYKEMKNCADCLSVGFVPDGSDLLDKLIAD